MDFKMLLLLTLMAVIGISYCENSAMKFSTKDCRLTEPVYNFTFDFNSLHSELAHVAKSNEDDTFEFNLCGNSSRTCDGQRNVAACLQRKDKEYILGRQHELNYVNGKMFFEFSNGSKCATGGGEYKLHVIVACDYTLDKVQSTVTAYSKDACSFYITFETPLACLPQPESIKNNQCSVKDSTTGHVYDLMPLSDTNYRTTDRNRSSFVLNVCKPVLYGENAMCPAGSSVCFLRKNNDSTTSYINYGTVQTKPTVENGMLIMTHTSDTPCLNNKNYSTIIYFTCNKDVKSAHPEFLGYKECVNKFSFATPLACNDLPPCTVTTHNGEILDMRSLQDKPFTLSMQNNNYTIGVCSAAKEPCLDSDGACQSRDKQSTSLGKWNAHLLYNQTGTPYLIYENGAECQLNGQTKYWSTKIEFVCANGSSNTNAATKDNNSNNKAAVTDSQALGPKIIENSNCELLIHYRTPLACQEQIQCKVKVGVEHSEDGTGIEVVDLTPLISVTENYEAKIDATLQKQLGTTTKFFLNVCRPLVSKYGLGCAGGSAACMATVKGANKPENEKSLGYPQASLVPINRTSVQLGYFHGAPCPSDKNSQMSSKIEFYCDMNAGRGVPVLRSMDDCHYHFSWATNVICPAHMCSFDEQTCEVVNDDLNARYNLKKASYTQQGKITYNQLTVDLCSSHHKAVTDYTQGLVNLFSTAQGACSNDNSSDTINVQMRITCAYETSSQFKMLPYTNGCSLYIEQRTPEICKFLSLDVPLPQNTSSIKTTTTFPQTTTVQPSNTHPAERTASIGSILAAILSLTFFVACVGIFAFSPERRNSLRRLLRRTSSSVRYSRVQSNEEANLLLEPNGHFTDSDDDMLL